MPPFTDTPFTHHDAHHGRKAQKNAADQPAMRAPSISRRMMLQQGMAAGIAAAVFTNMPSAAQANSAPGYTIDRIATGFDVPWSLAFLPDDTMPGDTMPGDTMLVTERDGRLLRVAPDGAITEITGLPAIEAVGQGGLLDVVVANDYAQSQHIFFSYTRLMPGGVGIAVARAELPPGGTKLVNMRQIFADSRGNDTGRHFGGRIVLQGREHLFLTIGDMGTPKEAQNTSSLWGKVLRLTQDGRVPKGNPFNMRRKGRHEIWSLGHRNPQGAALDSAGQLWTSEHGARGGDEVNRITPGANYGWPVISYGRNYSGSKIGQGTHKRGMQQPQHYWDPSIAPSGLAIYEGPMFPEWRGDLFIGSLKLDHIAQLSGHKGRAAGVREQRIEARETGRVRDVRVGPDGALWFLSEDNGALYRLARR